MQTTQAAAAAAQADKDLSGKTQWSLASRVNPRVVLLLRKHPAPREWSLNARLPQTHTHKHKASTLDAAASYFLINT